MQQLETKVKFEIKPHDSCITIHFNKVFEQEDLLMLCKSILFDFEQILISEIIEGADRLSCRFTFMKVSFQCHLEVYSQSCWIEAEYALDEIIFKKLVQFLNSQL